MDVGAADVAVEAVANEKSLQKFAYVITENIIIGIVAEGRESQQNDEKNDVNSIIIKFVYLKIKIK